MTPQQGLEQRCGTDGSFSLWSAGFGEGFHSGRGALREARETFVAPAELERFAPGSTLNLVEVCVGTGTNTAALLEACAARGLRLQWWGLELDPAPLDLALAAADFRRQWQPQTLAALRQLQRRGHWQNAQTAGRLLWGDARQTLAGVLAVARGQVDLVWHDAFSPRHCPQLWSVEFLAALAALLAPHGRWISYCSAAAVREGLRLAGLQLAALPAAETLQRGGGDSGRRVWSGGTLASPQPLPPATPWRPLTPMEQEHLASSAGEPYRDPSGHADAATMLAARQVAQAQALASGCRSPSSAWRRRWGLLAGCSQAAIQPFSI